MAVARYAKLTFSTDQRTGGWVRTSRTRERGSSRPGRTGRRDQNMGSLPLTYAGPVRITTLAVPSMSVSMSSPGPWLEARRAGLDAADERAHLAHSFLECEPRIPFAPLLGVGLLNVTVADAQGRDASGIAVEAARGQERVNKAQLETRGDGGRLELLVQLGDDLVERDERAWREQIEDLVR